MLTRSIACFFLCFIGFFGNAQQLDVSLGRTKLIFAMSMEGEPMYAVNFGDKPVVLLSRLGFSLSADSAFYKGFSIFRSEQRTVDESWKPVWGEVSEIRNRYKEL